jgi:hypothetical protein
MADRTKSHLFPGRNEQSAVLYPGKQIAFLIFYRVPHLLVRVVLLKLSDSPRFMFCTNSAGRRRRFTQTFATKSAKPNNLIQICRQLVLFLSRLVSKGRDIEDCFQLLSIFGISWYNKCYRTTPPMVTKKGSPVKASREIFLLIRSEEGWNPTDVGMTS